MKRSINGERFRLKRNWRGKLVLQVEEIRNHMDDLNGSGWYDEYQTKHWRDARLGDLPAEHLPIA